MADRTPDIPGVSESALGKMKIAELREHARERGIDGADELRKPELLARVKDWHHAEEHRGAAADGGAGRTSGGKKSGGATTSSGGKKSSDATKSGGATTSRGGRRSSGGKRSSDATKSGGATSGGAARSAGRNSTATDGTRGDTTADTPDVSGTDLSRLKVGELREHARERGIDGVDELRKPELLAAVKDWHYAQEHGGRRRPDAAANGGGKRTDGARERAAGAVKGAKDAKGATRQEPPKQDEDSVGDRLNLLRAAVRDLGNNLNALVRTLRSTIGM